MSDTHKTKPFEIQVGIERQKGYHWQKEREMIDNPDLVERTAYFEEAKRLDVEMFTKKVKWEREARKARKAEAKRNRKGIRHTANKVKKFVGKINIDEEDMDEIDEMEAEFADKNAFDILYDMDM